MFFKCGHLPSVEIAVHYSGANGILVLWPSEMDRNSVAEDDDYAHRREQPEVTLDTVAVAYMSATVI